MIIVMKDMMIIYDIMMTMMPMVVMMVMAMAIMITAMAMTFGCTTPTDFSKFRVFFPRRTRSFDREFCLDHTSSIYIYMYICIYI